MGAATKMVVIIGASPPVPSRWPWPAERTTLLALVMALPEPAAMPRVLGVEEFALRKGHHNRPPTAPSARWRRYPLCHRRDGAPQSGHGTIRPPGSSHDA
ncbi:hypothetical protein ACWEKM_07625 [Streptomyces sp. NPDC004752]